MAHNRKDKNSPKLQNSIVDDMTRMRRQVEFSLLEIKNNDAVDVLKELERTNKQIKQSMKHFDKLDKNDDTYKIMKKLQNELLLKHEQIKSVMETLNLPADQNDKDSIVKLLEFLHEWTNKNGIPLEEYQPLLATKDIAIDKFRMKLTENSIKKSSDNNGGYLYMPIEAAINHVAYDIRNAYRDPDEYPEYNRSIVKSLCDEQDLFILTTSTDMFKIINEPHMNLIVDLNLANLSNRNDSAGSLQRICNNLNSLKQRPERKIVSDIEKAEKLAQGITIKKTQVEMLNYYESCLIQAQKNNDDLANLRQYILNQGDPQFPNDFKKELESTTPIINHLKKTNPMITESLKEIEEKRRELLKSIKAEETKSIELGKALIHERRNLVQSAMETPQGTVDQKITLLHLALKTELNDKKNLIDFQIEQLKESRNNTNKRSEFRELNEKIGKHQKSSDKIQQLITKIEDNQHSNVSKIEQYNSLKEIIHSSKFNSISLLNDVKKFFDKCSSPLKMQIANKDQRTNRNAFKLFAQKPPEPGPSVNPSSSPRKR